MREITIRAFEVDGRWYTDLKGSIRDIEHGTAEAKALVDGLEDAKRLLTGRWIARPDGMGRQYVPDVVGPEG